ncbi:hypothetical protein BLJAPNOD_04322 [Ensifer sp. M14]|uniref:D-apionate lactonase n=1 Tax=Ensifer sp. M14 TaxID=2203782 RepID=UPI000E1D83CD|nr:hypothetical protein [Ensifer sp. M14]RDL48863.1 hypothetical protein BLJAPNOD_04322 [Ensifer sp. M14]
MTLSRAFLLFGSDEREPTVQRLQAGQLSVDLDGGNLRTIRFAEREVLRGISFLVRDRDWGTCEAALDGVQIEVGAERATVRYSARFAAPDGAILRCNATIALDPQSVTFAANFTPDRDFETARAGFVVLHPVVGVAGRPVAVEHGDGTIERAVFPDFIEPWQPFKSISAITHEAMPGVTAECRMTGDVFEMEDQRNWTDGSYKTYVRPLALPWPYILKAGETLRQSILLTITPSAPPVAADGRTPEAIEISLADISQTLPEIGLGLRPEDLTEELRHADLVAELGARHLICHFDPGAGHGVEALSGFRRIAQASGAKVTLECFLACRQALDEELKAVAADVETAGLTLSSIAVSPSVDRQSTPPGSTWPDCPPLEAVYAAAQRAFPGLPLGGGMFSYFTELNRKRVPAGSLSYLTHCTNPIVHAADDLSVMQTFEALRHVTRSVRAIYGDRPYRIGPSTIAMRQNPYGSATKDNPLGRRIAMANRDPRHNALFGVAWTLAYAATVAEAGLEVLTLSTLCGPFGLIAAAGEPMEDGGKRPLFHVLKWLAELAGRAGVSVETSASDALVGVGAATDSGRTVLLANISPQMRVAALGFVGKARITIVDENWMRSRTDEPKAVDLRGESVRLPAYAVARIEIPR